MRHTVLVIDDQLSMQEFERIVLDTAGYRVLLASDITSGLRLARTEHPDVAIVDMHLAEFGASLIADLRLDPTTATLPVILVVNQLIDMTQLPADWSKTPHCLHKPFEPGDLLVMVDHLINQEHLPMTA